MPWPIESDYQEALQSPRHCFKDPELRAGSAQVNALGLPSPISGAFASVYQVRSANRRWAVRCFLRGFDDQRKRYEAISGHLAEAKLPYMVDFEFQREGILIKGSWYPILKMEWVEGDLLGVYIAKNYTQRSKLIALAQRWHEMSAALRKAHIAHGDLQHDNVLVMSNGQIKLIDYDGMFVPALAGIGSHEEGHPNYKHPRRTGKDFGPEIDNFSAWVILLSLVALSVEPQLWRQLDGGDNALLFRSSDFERPALSPALAALDKSGKPELKDIATKFRDFLTRSPKQVPALDGSVTRTTSQPSSPSSLPAWLAEAVTAQIPEVGLFDEATLELSQLSTNADWILDHLLQDSPPPANFNSVTYRDERLLLLLLFSVLIGFGYATGVHQLSTISLWLSLSIGGGLGYLRFLSQRFGALDVVAARNTAVGQLNRSMNSTLDIETRLADVATRRRNLLANLVKIDKSYRGVQRTFKEELRGFTTQRDDGQGKLAEARERSQSQSIKKIDEVNESTTQSQLALDRKLVDYDRAQREEIEHHQATQLRIHQTMRLSRARLAPGVVSGIGVKSCARLAYYNIHSAADIGPNIWTLRAPRFGEDKIRMLLAWRQFVELEAAQSAPPVPFSVLSQIRESWAAKKRGIEAERRALELKRASAVQSLEQAHRAECQRIDLDQQDLLAIFSKRTEAAQAKCSATQKTIQGEFQAEAASVKDRRGELDEYIASLQKNLQSVRNEVATAERRTAKFSSIDFSRYIKGILYRRA